MSLGAFYTCYNEQKAIEYSVFNLNIHYPGIKTYLVTEGNIDYSYLSQLYPNLISINEEDTLSFNKKITDQNYKEEYFQIAILKSAESTINRLKKAIDYCKTEYIIMLDPDTLVNGKLTIPTNSKLLGSRINSGFPENFKNLLSSIDGAKVINSWGATPAIFNCEYFLKACNKLEMYPDLLKEFCQTFYAIFAHDVLLPLLFALIGEEEMFNPDIIECFRTPGWESSGKPLIHQFKKYYNQ